MLTIKNENIIQIIGEKYRNYIQMKNEIGYIKKSLEAFPKTSSGSFVVLHHFTMDCIFQMQTNIEKLELNIYNVKKEISDEILKINFEPFYEKINESEMFKTIEATIEYFKNKFSYAYHHKNTDGEPIIIECYYINDELFFLTNYAG